MRKFLTIGALVIGILVGVLALVALWIQFLWNSLVADVFGAPELGFVKALFMVAAIVTVRLFTRVTVVRVKR